MGITSTTGATEMDGTPVLSLSECMPSLALSAFGFAGVKDDISDISAGSNAVLQIFDLLEKAVNHKSMPFRLLLICLAGWLNQQQQDAIDYLQDRVLCEQLSGKRRRFSDDQRRRLAVRAKKLGYCLRSSVSPQIGPE